MKTLGLDFDDTLLDMRPNFVALMNRLHGVNHLPENLHTFSLHDHYNIPLGRVAEIFSQHQDSLHDIPPLPLVRETLAELRGKVRVIIITARPEDQMRSMHAWLKKMEIEVDAAYSSERWGSKGPCAKEHGVDLFVEDNPHAATDVADAGISVLLLDKNYNRPCEHENILRVDGWETIRRIMRESLFNNRLYI